MTAKARSRKSTDMGDFASQGGDCRDDNSSLLGAREQSRWPGKGSRYWAVLAFAMTIGLVLGALLGSQLAHNRNRTAMISAENATAPNAATPNTSKPQLTMAIHHAGSPITLQLDNNPDSDACSLLSTCFPDRFFAARPDLFPDAPLTRCQRNLRLLLNDYDSGFLYEGRRLVGFISSVIRRTDTNSHSQSAPPQSSATVVPMVELYNVCVRAEDRGRGLAKSLINLYLDQLAADESFSVAHVGLDVDFTSASAREAFALYAKLGFMRWWQPCRSIANFDFDQVRRTPARFPAAWWFLNRAGLGKDKFGGMTHFCMVKEWPGDDFYRLGSAMMAAINSKE